MSCELSIIVPAFNEAENIRPLYQRVCETLDAENIGFEIIFIDDGSTDGTLENIKQLVEDDSRVRFASFSRNFGHEAASSCGFKMASGEAAVLIDADLQDPPEVIPGLYEKWKQGFEVVCAKRVFRRKERFFRKASAYLFYRILRLFSSVAIPADVGDFRLVDRRVIDEFNNLPERNRFVRGMFSWIGFRQTAVEYEREARHQGRSKYNVIKLGLLSIDALVGFSVVPLRLCIVFGLLITALSFIMTCIITFQRLFLDLSIPGYALMTAGMFFLGGVQLTFLGVLGEYIGKIYTQVQGRPLYVVSESSEGTD